jgi:hypothetical protein
MATTMFQPTVDQEWSHGKKKTALSWNKMKNVFTAEVLFDNKGQSLIHIFDGTENLSQKVKLAHNVKILDRR